MKLLLVMLSVFVLSLFIIRLLTGDYNKQLAGCIAMSVLLMITAYGHVKYTEGMQLMMPPFIPFKKELVLITGVLEALAAVGLLLSMQIKHITAWCLIVFLVMILPANIYAALQHVDFQKADHSGSGPAYLWFRLPMQAVLIWWIWYFALRSV